MKCLPRQPEIRREHRLGRLTQNPSRTSAQPS